MIATSYLWKDDTILQNIGMKFLCKDFYQILDKPLFNENY